MASVSSSQVVTYDDLKIHKKLGDGGFSTVHHATLKRPFRGITEVAVKSVLELREEEVTILGKLDHQHVVKLYGFIQQSLMQLIVLEYAPNGTVHDYIKEHDSAPVPSGLLLKWLMESSLALKYLHRCRVIHRDIKGSNCLLFHDHLLKLSDFGLAREIKGSVTTSTAKGTWRYMAPEIHREDHFSFWSDVYAYGMLGLSMVSGKEPFDGMEGQTVVFQVCQNKMKPDIPSHCASSIADLLRQCWEFEPRDRPSADLIVNKLSALRGAENQHRLLDLTLASDAPPKLYDDQLEVALPALRGRNTLIIMPTGAGKTVVAASIIEKVVNDAEDKGSCNVIFMVPTGPLVKQQEERLKQCLRPRHHFNIVGIKGETMRIPLKEVLKNFNVVVLTAAILLEVLPVQDDNRQVKLESLDLLVFDECHHCMKDHVYNGIMKHYMCEKFERTYTAKLPQIVALTATTGTGKAKSQVAAEEHVFQLCANLDVEHISVVELNKNKLQERINVPEPVYPICVDGRPKDPFKTEVFKIMSDLEEMIKRCRAARTLQQPWDTPMDKKNRAYIQWLSKVDKESGERVEDGEQLRIIRTCVKHLQDYHVALNINAEVRTMDAFNYMKTKYEGMTNHDHMEVFNDTDFALLRKFLSTRQTFGEISTNPRYDNPLLKTLEGIIVREYQQTPNSRALLFCQTVEITKALKCWIEETDSLRFLQPNRMVGGMTAAQQKEILDKFREGKHLILVATSVLEEGIDVAECNLVIRLNYIPSDTGHVQVKGRGRAKNSKSYLVASSDCNYAAWEHANETRLSMSDRAIETLRSMPEEDYLSRIKARQKEDYYAHREKKLATSANRPRHWGEFDLLCGHCKRFACSTYDVGVYNSSHIVLSEEFVTERAKFSPHPKPKKIDPEFSKIGKIHCKNCNFDWGMVAIICQQKLPVIKISGFIIERELENGEVLRYMEEKWVEAKKIFHVKVLKREDLLTLKKREIPPF